MHLIEYLNYLFMIVGKLFVFLFIVGGIMFQLYLKTLITHGSDLPKLGPQDGFLSHNKSLRP